jgi:hypothetical protein
VGRERSTSCGRDVLRQAPGAIGGPSCQFARSEGIALPRALRGDAARQGRQFGSSDCRNHLAGQRDGRALGSHEDCRASPTRRFEPPVALQASGQSGRTWPRVLGESGPPWHRPGRKNQPPFASFRIPSSDALSLPIGAQPTLGSESRAPAQRAFCFPHHRRRDQSAPAHWPRGQAERRGRSALARTRARARSSHSPRASAG